MCRLEHDNARKQTEWAKASMRRESIRCIFFFFFLWSLFLHVWGRFVSVKFSVLCLLLQLKSQQTTPSSYVGRANMLSSINCKRRTLQRNQPSNPTQMSKARTHVPIRVRQREQAGSVGQGHIMAPSIYISTSRRVLKTNKSKAARPKKSTTIYMHAAACW